MTIDANEPTDQRMVSELPSYIRANRSAINTIIASDTEYTVTTLSISAGDTALVIGTDLTNIGIEVLIVSGTGAVSISQIRGGTEGQIKIFIFQDNDISFVDGLKLDGALYLNQLPVLSSFNAQQDDVIALINIGGNGAAVYGYWKELWRQISVK